MRRTARVSSLVLAVGVGVVIAQTPAGAVYTGPLCHGLKPKIVAVPGEPAIGTSRGDVILGTPGADIIRSGPGMDRICGRGGNDRVYAGPNGDLVWGGTGDDYLVGGDDWDTLKGGPGADDLRGGPRDDNLWGNVGDDRLRGGGRRDRFIGGPGRDRIFAGDDDVDQIRLAGDGDTVDGSVGDIVTYGHSDAPAVGPVTVDLTAGRGGLTGSGTFDTIHGVGLVRGTPYSDVLIGDDGDNTLYAGDGDDSLDGRAGRDELFGDVGSDSCVNGENLVGCEIIISSFFPAFER